MSLSKFAFCILVLVCFSPFAAALTYTVRSGDTLYRIAKQHRTTVASVVQLNRIQGKPIRVGMRLQIPPPVTTSAQQPIRHNVHVVTAGETLFSIARKHAMTVDDLRFRNKLGTTPLRVGQRLDVAGKQLSKWAAARPRARRIHIERGETLYSIAQKHGASIQTLVRLNGNIIRNRPLVPGANILVPITGQNPQVHVHRPSFHTFKAGETFSSIARKYQLSASVLQNANPIVNPNRISIGKTLRIPQHNSLTMRQILGAPTGRILSGVGNANMATTAVFHKQYPNGTILHLSNPHTAKSAFARVMGRLQHSSRVIMLISPTLAQALGMRATTHLEVRKVKRP